MFYFFVLSCLIATLLVPVTPYNYQNHEEGACGQYTPQSDFKYDWFITAPNPRFNVAGNKYHLYRITNGVPDHDSISEEDFLQTACIEGSVDATTGIGQLSVFGQTNIGNFQIKLTDQDGVVDVVHLDTPEQFVSRHTVTFTDNKSFVFFANCWEDSQQRGWEVVSLTPTLDASTFQLITEHATSLGFDPANFVLFNANSCGAK